MTSKDKTKKEGTSVFGIPPELKPAITNWAQERVKRIEAGKLPYMKDGLLFSLWKYANAEKLTGKSLIAFTDLLPLEGTDRFVIYEFLDEINNLKIELENITFHLEIYKKYCPAEYEAIEAYIKDGRSTSFNEAIGKVFRNQAVFTDIFDIFGKFDELAKFKLRLSGLMEFIEFSANPSEKNLKPLKTLLDKYLKYFIENKLFSFELKNYYNFNRQKEIFFNQIKNELRDYGQEFIFRQGETVSVIKGLVASIGKDEAYLFIHTLAALEKEGYLEVKQILITDMDTPPEEQTNDYKVKIRKIKDLSANPRNIFESVNKIERKPKISTDKEREWFNYFIKIGTIKDSSKQAEELKKEFNSYSPFNGKLMKNLLKETDFTITELPSEIKKMDWIFREYNSTPYSLEKSRSVILASLDRLSEKYETIPLVYTTLPYPTSMYFPSDIWREILSTHSFDKEDFGHIDFLNALNSLIEDGVIGLLFFDTIYVDDKNLALKATIIKYKRGHIKEEPSKIKQGLSFDDSKGIIRYGDKECEIPINTNQYFLCQKMFQEPFGKRIKEIEVLDLVDWDEDSKRSVYDAMRAVNRKANEVLKIEKLFEWRNNHIWIKESLS